MIAQLNRIFGYGGHSWEVTAGPKLIGSTGVDQQTGEIDSAIGYTCMGRLTVSTQSGPVSFDGVGAEKLDGLSFNSHDKALKGAETDAMKRAARHLGAQFGLSLYFGGAFDVPAHFRVEGGQPPAKAEPARPASRRVRRRRRVAEAATRRIADPPNRRPAGTTAPSSGAATAPARRPRRTVARSPGRTAGRIPGSRCRSSSSSTARRPRAF